MYSPTAKQANTSGDPLVIANLTATASLVNAIEARFGRVTVTSGFRTGATNAAIGGASGSQHLKGEAADFVPSTMSNMEMAGVLYKLRGQLPLDQVIWYEDTHHVHVSTKRSGRNRSQFLVALTKRNGKRSYDAWTPGAGAGLMAALQQGSLTLAPWWSWAIMGSAVLGSGFLLFRRR